MTTAKERPLETLNENPEQFMDVLKRRGGLRVSILLPIATEPPQSNKNASRLKNQYQDALEKLMENGLQKDKAVDFLRPVEALLEEPKSLLRPAEALALYIDESSASLVELPYAVDSQVTVGNRVIVKPLLPLLQHDSDFKIACLNRGEIKIYKGTRMGLTEVHIPDMPTALSEVAQFDDPQKSMQHHTAKTGAAKGRPGSSPVAQMHGQGLPADMEKSQNERLFRDVANAVKKHFANDRSPLILFGVDENLGLFRSAIDWGEHTIFSVHHDPKEWSKAEIHRRATKELMPYWEKQIADKVERLEQAYSKNSGVFDTGECALAAANGRVEMACVASDQAEPGICEPETMKVEFVEAPAAGCAHDLLDTIAYETILHGGEVFVLPADKVPGPGNVAATVRFEV